jgi:hypothetical protein
MFICTAQPHPGSVPNSRRYRENRLMPSPHDATRFPQPDCCSASFSGEEDAPANPTPRDGKEPQALPKMGLGGLVERSQGSVLVKVSIFSSSCPLHPRATINLIAAELLSGGRLRCLGKERRCAVVFE